MNLASAKWVDEGTIADAVLSAGQFTIATKTEMAEVFGRYWSGVKLLCDGLKGCSLYDQLNCHQSHDEFLARRVVYTMHRDGFIPDLCYEIDDFVEWLMQNVDRICFACGHRGKYRYVQENSTLNELIRELFAPNRIKIDGATRVEPFCEACGRVLLRRNESVSAERRFQELLSDRKFQERVISYGGPKNDRDYQATV